MEEKLHRYSKQFGVVCGIDIDGCLGKVWYRAENEARNMVNGLQRSGLCNGAAVYNIYDDLSSSEYFSTSKKETEPNEYIIVDSDDEYNDDGGIKNSKPVRDVGLTTKELWAASISSETTTSLLKEEPNGSVQMTRSWDLSRPDSIRKKASVNMATALKKLDIPSVKRNKNLSNKVGTSSSSSSQDRSWSQQSSEMVNGVAMANGVSAGKNSRRHIALKSTGGRAPGPRSMVEDASIFSQMDLIPLLKEIYKNDLPAEQALDQSTTTSRNSSKKKKKKKKNGGWAKRLENLNKAKKSMETLQDSGSLQLFGKQANNEVYYRRDLDFRGRAPFIYQYIHMYEPRDIESTGSRCLSMAWNPVKQRNKLDLFVSQGNTVSVEDMKYICYNRGPSDGSRSTVVQYEFEIPKRFDAEMATNTLQVFNSEETLTQCVSSQEENNSGPVVSLKLYDQGRVMLGCSTYGVIVWTTDPMKHKQTLILIEDVSGVYDVGSNYIVTNSANGEMGVWKAGSANYIWRYNDTRRYRKALPEDYEMPTIITSLKIAPNDTCTYIGNSQGALSMSDFREPYIQDLGLVKKDGISSIELIGDQQMLVGTQAGDIELYDVRFAGKDVKLGSLYKFSVPTGSVANQIQVCPSNPRAFACASGSNVYIYRNQVNGSSLPAFTHFGHRTAVADFRWHPTSQDYDYTIGSMETGGKSGRGLIQVWRPTDFILNEW
ncbi:hypothetical protein FB639_001374 [Coemansia asiatica]|nr:hypothetical protein FB639_001374 [Coemansia asiatica]